MMVMIAGELSMLAPSRVAFTNSPTVPIAPLAVKVTEEPMEELSEPAALFVRLHEYVIPSGQELVQVSVAAKLAISPVAIVSEVGVIASSAPQNRQRASTASVTVLFALFRALSFT
jgi:hypothetical protein